MTLSLKKLIIFYFLVTYFDGLKEILLMLFNNKKIDPISYCGYGAIASKRFCKSRSIALFVVF
jgi:hypothetical protein